MVGHVLLQHVLPLRYHDDLRILEQGVDSGAGSRSELDTILLCICDQVEEGWLFLYLLFHLPCK